MTRTSRNWLVTAGCAALCTIGIACAVGASTPATTSAIADEGAAPAAEAAEQEPWQYLEGLGIENIYSNKAQRAADYAPEVITLEDGRQVQRTPDSGGSYWYDDAPSVYNTYYLKADQRGCETCHTEGLAKLLESDTTLVHWPLDNGLGTNINALDCLMCHNEHGRNHNGVTHSFGDMIHGIHNVESSAIGCMTCHTATADGQGPRLWEEAKYDVLHGIKDVADVQGDFYYEQETLGGYTALSLWPGLDNWGYARAFDGAERDQETFDNWEITVSGLVDNPFTITLKELIETAPSETFISSGQCIVNPPSGEQLCNVEVTGIPISRLLEKAGVQDSAVSVITTDPDGDHMFMRSPIENFETEDAWIIYEVNGEPLTLMDGWPCRSWFPEHGISMGTRNFNEIIVTDEPVRIDEGASVLNGAGGPGSWIGDPENPDVEWANKPNVGICDTPEGLIIPVGEPYEFKGFADAFDEQVVAMEFSMDGGQTWTSFDVPESDPRAWVYWHFTWTPEETGAYVLSVRGVSETGVVTRTADQVMVNVK